MFAAGAQGWWWAILVPVLGVVVALGTTRYRRNKEARGGYPHDPLTDPDHYRDAPVPRLITQPAWVRWLLGVSGVLFVAMGAVTVAFQPTLWFLAGVMVVLGVLITVRMPRLGIVVDADRLVVRGVTHSVTIPRASITGIDRLPSIDWTGHDGISRDTLVWALTGSADTAHDPNAIMRARAHANLSAWLSGTSAE
jgi:hypothetical protein